MTQVKQFAIFIQSNQSKFVTKTYLNGITIAGNISLPNITHLINILNTEKCEEKFNDFDDEIKDICNTDNNIVEIHPHKDLTFEELKNMRMPQNNKIYVKGLPIKLCNKQRLETNTWFGKFGIIKQITVNKEFVAFITFEQRKDALHAIEIMNGFDLGNDRTLTVMSGLTGYCSYFLGNTYCKIRGCTLMHKWMDKKDIIRVSEKDEFHQDLVHEQLRGIRILQPHLLYVKNIPNEICVERLLISEKWFGRFGKVVRIHLEPKSNGICAYIEYNKNDIMAVKQSVRYFDRHPCNDGKIMRVMPGYTFYCSLFLQRFKCENKSCFGLHKWANIKNIMNKNIIKPPKKDIFYDNLSFEQLKNLRIIQSNIVYLVGLTKQLCNEQILQSNEWFGKFGDIENVSLPKNTFYDAKKFSAFITFNDEKNANNAIQNMNGYQLNNGSLIRATHGCKRICARFLKNEACSDTNCTALHEWPNIKYIVNRYKEPSFPDIENVNDNKYKPQNILYSTSAQRCKLKFEQWLEENVGLSQYLKVFQKHEYDDITMIKYFDDDDSTYDVLKNELGINNELHCKLIIEKINEFH
eukprot:407172_1